MVEENGYYRPLWVRLTAQSGRGIPDLSIWSRSCQMESEANLDPQTYQERTTLDLGDRLWKEAKRIIAARVSRLLPAFRWQNARSRMPFWASKGSGVCLAYKGSLRPESNSHHSFVQPCPRANLLPANVLLSRVRPPPRLMFPSVNSHHLHFLHPPLTRPNVSWNG